MYCFVLSPKDGQTKTDLPIFKEPLSVMSKFDTFKSLKIKKNMTLNTNKSENVDLSILFISIASPNNFNGQAGIEPKAVTPVRGK
jgi:hypothetical protein